MRARVFSNDRRVRAGLTLALGLLLGLYFAAMSDWWSVSWVGFGTIAGVVVIVVPGGNWSSRRFDDWVWKGLDQEAIDRGEVPRWRVRADQLGRRMLPGYLFAMGTLFLVVGALTRYPRSLAIAALLYAAAFTTR